jgi:NADH-quinone oxidoreductase subunit K
LIFILMSMEVMLNAAGLAFVVAGSRWQQSALLLQLYHRYKSLDADATSLMRG